MALNRRDYFALSILQMMANGQKARGFTFSVDRRSDEVYRVIKQRWDDKKKFLLTVNTTKRISAMDMSALTAEKLLLICNEGERCGVICEEPDGQSRISLIYAICKDHIVIEVFDGKTPAVGDDATLMRAMVGTIVIMGNEFSLTTNSSIEYVLNKELLKSAGSIDPMYLKELKRYLREVEKLGKDYVIDNVNVPNDCPFITRMFGAYHAKKSLLMNALKMFVFVHCAEVKNAQYISDDDSPAQVRHGRRMQMDYYLVDSVWDHSIEVINPFKVSGHFKMQPYGDGRQLRKLIYVDDYMKHGYVRKAGIEKMRDSIDK